MARNPIISTKAFQGIRVEVDTLVSFDEVLSRLRGQMGYASVSDVVTLAKEATTEAEFIAELEERLVGKNGFMQLITEDGYRGLAWIGALYA
jgi:hypothetical protein